MDLAEAHVRAKELFQRLSPPTSRDLSEVGRREGQGKGIGEQFAAMTPSGFPYPELLLFGFTELLGVKTYGPEEKLRWGFQFDYQNSTFGFELRKFGLRALCEPRNLDEPILREVLGKSRALTRVAEAYLAASIVENQLVSGNFTMENLYGRLDSRYRFLREQAEKAYATPLPVRKTIQSPNATRTLLDYARPSREGGALGTAAVDAYFSRLEHFFCLAIPFVGNVVRGQDLRETLAANWGVKAKAVLDLGDPPTKKLYDNLLAIREEWRNPLAHGGFLSGGGSLYFHVPRIGALPARLLRTPNGARVGFWLTGSSFTDITTVFDSFDAQLKIGPLKYALRWIESKLDVAFDQESIKEYRRAARSEAEFEEYLEHQIALGDLHANMDY